MPSPCSRASAVAYVRKLGHRWCSLLLDGLRQVAVSSRRHCNAVLGAAVARAQRWSLPCGAARAAIVSGRCQSLHALGWLKRLDSILSAAISGMHQRVLAKTVVGSSEAKWVLPNFSGVGARAMARA